MSHGETKLRGTVKNGKSRGNINFLHFGSEEFFFFFFLRVKIMLMSHLSSSKLRFDGKMGCVPMAEERVKTKMC